MSASANMFNIYISDHDVRLTFVDQRPNTVPDEVGRVMDRNLRHTVVGEVVISHFLMRQLLDLGTKLLDDHLAKQKTEKGSE